MQSFHPPPIATLPQHDTAGLGDVRLFEAQQSATPRTEAASAPAKQNQNQKHELEHKNHHNRNSLLYK